MCRQVSSVEVLLVGGGNQTLPSSPDQPSGEGQSDNQSGLDQPPPPPSTAQDVVTMLSTGLLDTKAAAGWLECCDLT